MAPSNLNVSEKVIKGIHEFNGLVKHTFTTNLDTAAPPSNPNDVHAGLLADLASQLPRIPQNILTALEIVKAKANGGLIDDKKYVIEDLIQIAASLPSDSKNAHKISEAFVEKLWGNLKHPPLSYLGNEWRFRTADGSNNNRFFPHLGKAGSPYARTLPPRTELSPNLPDPGLIFDEVFARGEEAREHPNRISSMLFHFASIIIHDIFRTSDTNQDVVDSSSYLDLSPLYGHNPKEQYDVRSHKDGLLHPDVFSEIRLLGFPPGVGALLVCFNRFHNYIARELKSINEGGRFSLGRGKDPEGDLDEVLFQTARLITCGLYINIVLVDYVRTILNLNRTNSEWNLDPRVSTTGPGPNLTPEAVGNQVSVEFNLVYRWHSAISKKDEKWSVDFFKQHLNGRDPSTVSSAELQIMFKEFLMKGMQKPVTTWEFGGMKRDKETGAFKDEELAEILKSSTEDVAGAFGARNVPVCMKAIEVLGMQQARKWNVATLNEFRKYFGLLPHKTFQDITSNAQVAESLETLYGSPDLVELYPGLVAEDGKAPKIPGSGLCPGFTNATAILADAVALVRGDRFYTVDFNAASLTNWGFGQIASNPRVAGGGVIYKLLMRALPNWYKGNSVYALFPFTHPAEQRKILRNLDQEMDFDYTPPRHIADPVFNTRYNTIAKIINDQNTYKVPWGPNTTYIIERDYMLSGDSPANAQQRKFVDNALMCPAHGMEDIQKLYYETTSKLFVEKSKKLRTGFYVDVVADIGNIAHAMCAADVWHVPLKTKEHPVGPFTPFEFFTIYCLLFAWVFLDADPASEFNLRYYAKQASDPLRKIVKAMVTLVQADHFTELKDWLGIARTKNDISRSYGARLVKRLSEGGKSADEVTAVIVPTMAAMVATQATGFAQMIDVLLSEPYREKHWRHIEQLSRSEDPHDFEKLKKYALEAYRLATPAYGVLRTVEVDSVTIQDGDKTYNLGRGDRVYTNFVSAGLDEEVFPNPHEIDLNRDPSLYIHHGLGPHQCLGKTITNNAMAAQLKACGQLENLRKSPGPEGRLKYKLINDSIRVFMKADQTDYWPVPTTMKLRFDGFSPEMQQFATAGAKL